MIAAIWIIVSETQPPIREATVQRGWGWVKPLRLNAQGLGSDEDKRGYQLVLLSHHRPRPTEHKPMAERVSGLTMILLSSNKEEVALGKDPPHRRKEVPKDKLGILWAPNFQGWCRGMCWERCQAAASRIDVLKSFRNLRSLHMSPKGWNLLSHYPGVTLFIPSGPT